MGELSIKSGFPSFRSLFLRLKLAVTADKPSGQIPLIPHRVWQELKICGWDGTFLFVYKCKPTMQSEHAGSCAKWEELLPAVAASSVGCVPVLCRSQSWLRIWLTPKAAEWFLRVQRNVYIWAFCTDWSKQNLIPLLFLIVGNLPATHNSQEEAKTKFIIAIPMHC